ncbi:hypothetical protein DMA11_18235 [Marinilabiliaceae bacterium JC017]|nr:hypothetical protein DMA11_18235 [Marinilabiliaceae bacterium JC017]
MRADFCDFFPENMNMRVKIGVFCKNISTLGLKWSFSFKKKDDLRVHLPVNFRVERYRVISTKESGAYL